MVNADDTQNNNNKQQQSLAVQVLHRNERRQAPGPQVQLLRISPLGITVQLEDGENFKACSFLNLNTNIRCCQ